MKNTVELEIIDLSILKDLSDERAGQLFKAIYQYRKDKDAGPMTEPVEMLFLPFRNKFLIQDEKYQRIVLRNQNNGSKAQAKPVTQQEVKAPESVAQPAAVEPERPKKKVAKPRAKKNPEPAVEGAMIDSEKPRIDTTPFSPGFYPNHWEKWIRYKQVQHGFKHKSQESEQVAFKILYESLSNKNEDQAIATIEKAMSEGWKGLQPLKDWKQSTKADGSKFDKLLSNEGAQADKGTDS